MSTSQGDAAVAPNKQSRRSLLINNLVAALIGATITLFLHELAHLFTGLALGYPGTLYPFGVNHDGNPSAVDEAIMALAGPAFSIVFGILIAVWNPLRRRADFTHLVWLWLAFTSIQEGVTYLCLTPFGAGDTGLAAQLLEVPVALQFVALAVGIAGMLANAWAFAPHLARHASADGGSRNAMSLFPWLYGMITMVLLSVIYLVVAQPDLDPGSQVAVAAAGMGLLVFAPMANIFWGRVAHLPHEPLNLRPVPWVGVVILALLIIGNLILCIGWTIG